MKTALLVLPVLLLPTLPTKSQERGLTIGETNSAPAADCRKILDSYRELLLKGQKPDAASIQRFIETLSPEGYWADIDYTDKTLSNWKPLRHLDRVTALYTALKQPDTTFSNDAKVRDAAQRSLGWWLRNKPKESQWYHLNISVPREMRDIILLAGDELKGEERDLAMKQLQQLKVNGTGANLVWSADLGLHEAALRGDGARVAEMAAKLAAEVKVSDFEGIRDDWSFHQHGPRLQTFHYGKSFLAESTRIAWQLRDTPWAYPQGKLDLLSGLVLNGWRWQMRGNQTVPSTVDRAVSREGALRVNHQSTLQQLAEVDKSHAKELLAVVKSMNDGTPAVQGFKWFPRSDFAAYQTANASVFLKTISSRSNTTESINNENLLGAQLNIGNQFVLKDGQEYFDLMPCWDWKRLPGVTWPEWAGINNNRDITVVKQPFSGAVTDGKNGMVAWEEKLESKDKTKSFSIRKTTFFIENTVVSTWAAPINSAPGEVSTTAEQCRWRGEIWGGTKTTSEKLASPGGATAVKGALDWVWHNGTGYVALIPGSLNFSADIRSGKWKTINTASSDAPISAPVFTAWVKIDDFPDQEVFVRNAPAGPQGGYVTLLNSTAKETQAFAARPMSKWNYQATNAQSQFFSDREKSFSIMLALFSPEGVNYPFQVDHPCLIFYDGQNLWASDPLHKGGSLNITYPTGKETSKKVSLDLPADGSSVSVPAPGVNQGRIDLLKQTLMDFRDP